MKFMQIIFGVLMMTQAVLGANEVTKEYVSWDEIREIVSDISKGIDKDQVDVICGISVGGLVPTALFSLELGEKNVVSISCRSYEGYEQKEAVISNGPANEALEGKRVLLVDDIIDSGITIEKIVEYLYENYEVKSIDVAVLYINTDHIQCERPAYFGRETTEWIVFPWEERFSK